MTKVSGQYCETLKAGVEGGLGRVEAAAGAGADQGVQGLVGVGAADDQEACDVPQLFPRPTTRWKMHCLEITLRRCARSARLNNKKKYIIDLRVETV